MLAQVRASSAVPNPASSLVGDRNMRYGALVTDSGGTYRFKQVAQVSVTDLSLTFGNWYTAADPTGDTDGPNSYTINECWLEHNSSLTQVLFSGNTSVSIPAGGTAVGTVTKTISYGQTYYIRSYVTPDTGGGSYPKLAIGALDFPGEVSAKGSNHANELGTTNLPSLADVFGPNMITGTLSSGTTVRSVAVVGDSIAFGIGDDFSSPTHLGFIYRALSGFRPFLLYPLSGESAQRFLANGAHRKLYLGPGAKYLICEHGVNDMQGSRTLAQLQADLITIWNYAISLNPGLKVFQTTITPKSTSTDSWTTTVNQTTSSLVEGVRPTFNDWLRAGAPTVAGVAVTPGTGGALLAGQPGHPLWGYLEIADLVEPSRNAGIWKANYTGDGIHPSLTGHVAMVPGIDLGRMT